MAEEATNIHSVTTASDGTVKITIEKYNELVKQAAKKPEVINKTVVNKTPEMLAQENQAWGVTFMGGGAAMFIVGAIRFWRGRHGS